MVTPEEIAKAMAVHSVEDEPRRPDREPGQVMVDDERVTPEDGHDDERDAGQGTADDVSETARRDVPAQRGSS